VRAPEGFVTGKGDFADHAIKEHARAAGCDEVATFDRALLEEPGSSRPEPFEASSHATPFERLDQDFCRDANRVADASLLEIVAFAEPVHDRHAHGENLRHLADGQEPRGLVQQNAARRARNAGKC
jgi:hypothetical protein